MKNVKNSCNREAIKSHEEYKAFRKKYYKAVETARTEHYQKAIEEANMAQKWKIANKLMGRKQNRHF